MSHILITGSSGLIGRHLRHTLEANGHIVRGLDLTGVERDRGDIRDHHHVATALAQITGVVHLAAVSRVVWGEQDPETCWRTNVDGLRNLLERAQRRPAPPWLIFASSREVYGQPDSLPASEDAPRRPVNAYGRSKLAGEHLIEAASEHGLRAAIVRLSNVYGCTRDHTDRVVPAFARAAALGATLRVDGVANEFDFTHVRDTVRGLTGLVEQLDRGAETPPPIQFVTGTPTTLGQLARLAIGLGDRRATLAEAPSRSFDVARFHGSGSRAERLLDWRPRISIEQGLARLVADFRAELDPTYQRAGGL